MKKRIQPQRKRRRGAALVEVAFALPVFFLVVLGVIEFGRAMMVAQMVTTAAREGTRIGVLNGKTNTDVQTAIQDFMTAAANLSSDQYSVVITVTPDAGNPDPLNEVGNASKGDEVTVAIQVPFANASWIAPNWLADANLIGRCEMRHE